MLCGSCKNLYKGSFISDLQYKFIAPARAHRFGRSSDVNQAQAVLLSNTGDCTKETIISFRYELRRVSDKSERIAQKRDLKEEWPLALCVALPWTEIVA